MSAPVHIGILGAEGRMGQALLREIEQCLDAKLTAAITSPSSASLGMPYGSTQLTADIRAALNVCDVLIDFSHPKAAIDAALMMHATSCKAFVTGTTGYSSSEEAALVAASDSIALVKSGNFSIGVCVLENLVKAASRTLGASWDISILDIHHRHKKDAPSGTALMLGAAAQTGNTDQTIAYTDQRMGGIIGEHHVSFASTLETLTLSHTANDRSVFAAGALTAALWAANQPKGLYSMKDVLGF